MDKNGRYTIGDGIIDNGDGIMSVMVKKGGWLRDLIVSLTKKNPDPEIVRDHGSAFAIVSAVKSTDKDSSVQVRIIGSSAEITVRDKDGNLISPDNVTITSPDALIANGAKNAEMRMSDKLTVEIDLEAATNGRKGCSVTVDNNDGVIVVSCNGFAIFEADLSDISDQTERLVYDGKTVKAIDADGRVVAEFDLN